MAKIEPHHSWLALEQHAAELSNPRHKGLVTEVRNHMEFEIKGQIEPLMGTLTAQPIYHFWNDEPFVVEGYDAVYGFYENLIASGSNQFQVVVERIVVDDGAVITEGQVKQVYAGAVLNAAGTTQIGDEPVAAEDLILTTTQLLTVWPGDPDGKLIGEDIYFGHNPFRNVEKITEADLPSYYRLPG
jgi:hypothetical protein